MLQYLTFEFLSFFVAFASVEATVNVVLKQPVVLQNRNNVNVIVFCRIFVCQNRSENCQKENGKYKTIHVELFQTSITDRTDQHWPFSIIYSQ